MMQSVPNTQEPGKEVRHILSLSGGKDSTALAVYLKDRIPDLEYVFCDTGEELPGTLDYLTKIEAYLGKKIVYLNPDRPFRHYLQIYRGVLPDPRARWCTRMLKIKPFERFIKDDPVMLYVGIRYDERHRKGYISTKPNITSSFPFIENGINLDGVIHILDKSGLGLPAYYSWRSRSGCYFCFFQQKLEWIGLLENHPDLFEEAMKFEKFNSETGESYTWIKNESLAQIKEKYTPEGTDALRERYLRLCKNKTANTPKATLLEIFETAMNENKDGCLICHL